MIGTLLIIIIIGILLYVLIRYNYGKKLDIEKFIIENAEFDHIYDKSIDFILENIESTSKPFIVMSSDKFKNVNKAVKEEMNDFYTKVQDQDKLILEAGQKLADTLITEIEKEYGGKLPEKLVNWIQEEIPEMMQNHLEFNTDKKYHFPTTSGDFYIAPHPEDDEHNYSSILPSSGHNPIAELITKGKPPSFVGKIPKPVNTNDILLGLNHGGQAASFVARPTTDYRGLPEPFIRHLAERESTQKRGGLERSARYDVIDTLENARGLCNGEYLDKALNYHVDKYGNKIHETFRHIRSRIPIDNYSHLGAQTKTVETNVLNDIFKKA